MNLHSSAKTCPYRRALLVLRVRRLPAAPRKKVRPVRYELAEPGGLLHLDTKRLGNIQAVGHRIHGDHSIRQRGIGYETVHVCIDACTRAAFVEVLPDETKETTAAFCDGAPDPDGQRDVRPLQGSFKHSARSLPFNS